MGEPVIQMRKFDRFQKAEKVSIEFDSVSDRRLYLRADGKYDVTVSFDQVLNDKASVKYSRYKFSCTCTCTHYAMRTCLPSQELNFCKHILAAIAWLVNNKGKIQ